MGRSTTFDAAGSASTSADDRYGPHLRIDRGSLHLVKDVSDLFQISDMSTVRIEGPVLRCTLREGVNEEFLSATGVDLEMELVRDGV